MTVLIFTNVKNFQLKNYEIVQVSLSMICYYILYKILLVLKKMLRSLPKFFAKLTLSFRITPEKNPPEGISEIIT